MSPLEGDALSPPLWKETWWSTHHAEGAGPHLDEDQAFPRTEPARKVNPLVTLPWVPQPSPLQGVPPTWSSLSPTSPTASQSSRGTRKSRCRGSPAWPSSTACLQGKQKGVKAELVISCHPLRPGDLVFFRGSGRAVGSKNLEKLAKLMRIHKFLVVEPLPQKIPDVVGEVFLES